MRNEDIFFHKLGPSLIRTTNYRLEVVTEEEQKKEEMVEKWKVEAIDAKQYKARGKISLLNKKKDENDIKNDMDLDQGNAKYLL